MIFKLLVRFAFSFRSEADKIFSRRSGVTNYEVQIKAKVQLYAHLSVFRDRCHGFNRLKWPVLHFVLQHSKKPKVAQAQI
jgi:hypothetical protein